MILRALEISKGQAPKFTMVQNWGASLEAYAKGTAGNGLHGLLLIPALLVDGLLYPYSISLRLHIKGAYLNFNAIFEFLGQFTIRCIYAI